MRFHAFGDVVITLPYLQALKNALPDADVHLLTRAECADIPMHARMFSKVYAIDDRRSAPRLAARGLALVPALRRERYDAVLDLQRNAVSRMIRRLLAPKSFAEFDRFSPLSAGERVKRTIDALHAAQLGTLPPMIDLREPAKGGRAWGAAGYAEQKRYIILNPAGSAVTKNWPIGHYARFARLWNTTVDGDASFMILGTDRIAEKAAYLKHQLGDRAIVLVNLTTAAEAMMLLRKAAFVLSEDSGLMHMAWISRVPLVALFGSTSSVWSAPQGETSVCLDSSDLECGQCNRSQCIYGDVRCLARYTPEHVLDTARRLFERIELDERRD